MTLGNRIREARIRQRLTQKDVAGAYITRNMLSKIENGSATPSVMTLKYLSEALSVPVGYLMNGETDGPSELRGHLSEIGRLAGLIMDGARAEPLALCIKARALLASGEAEAAKELLTSSAPENFSAGERRDIYAALEECCKASDDYKAAYEYACKRIT